MPVRLLALLALLAMLLPLAEGAQARSLEQIRERLDEVGAEREEVEERIADSTRALADLEARIDGIARQEAELRSRVAELRRELDELVAVVATRVRETYKHGATVEPIAVFLASEDPDAALNRAQTVSLLVGGDQARNEELAAARRGLQAAEARLVEQSRALEAAHREQAEVVEQLRDDFDEIESLEARLTREEREERDRIRLEEQRRNRDQQGGLAGEAGVGVTAAAATEAGGDACPLDQPRHFIDSWGYARSGGRSHRGTDIMGPRGIPVRAIVDGTWRVQSRGASAGVWGILHGDDGHDYWYLHLDGHRVGDGTRVRAGQQVATNGATGNATPGAEHVHFELHPGGGSAVNPYGLLRSVCG